MIENGGVIVSANTKGPKELPFHLPYEKRVRFSFSETPIPASEIARRLNALADHSTMKKMTYATITSWLSEIGVLDSNVLPSGRKAKHPTPKGAKLGITVAERAGPQGSYQVIVYDTQAQHFIIDNLDAILESEYTKTELQGTPWIQAHDDCLKDLYQKGAPLSEIAITLKRNTGAIRARLKKFGLIEKTSDG